ncbi:hypothetical protein [Tardiphaga sp.]|uniref:hypothetical protein n=1 Tax=Tardiphaga sp. TaxID=1926292 RepID=UPI0025DF352F|nr:hypothetical protein [Tardiphaga sp.]
MSSAIEVIVAIYVDLGQLVTLQDLKAHREKLAASMRSRDDFEYSLLLRQIGDDVVAIDAGIRRLRAQTEARLAEGVDGYTAAAGILSALQRR